jgi:hypothetical protein
MQAYGSADKRMASLIMCISAETEDPAGNPYAASQQPVSCGVVFAGKGMQIPLRERSLYRNGVRHLQIYFQPAAWCGNKLLRLSTSIPFHAPGYLFIYRLFCTDEVVMLQWLEQFDLETAHIHAKYGIRFLGLDGHGAQLTTAFKRTCAEKNIFLLYTPPNCTDIVAPVDHHVGAALKAKIRSRYIAHLRQNFRRWRIQASEGGFTDSARRMLLAGFVDEAYRELKISNQHLLRQCFVSTGWLIATDGSEDKLIKVPGVPNYRFR